MRDGAARRRRRPTGPAALAGALLALLVASGASAAEWRYCYAFDAAARRFSATEPFATNEPSPALEAALRRHLVEAKSEERPAAPARLACPRADTREGVVAMRRASAEYQREQRNAVVALDWTPGEAVARR